MVVPKWHTQIGNKLNASSYREYIRSQIMARKDNLCSGKGNNIEDTVMHIDTVFIYPKLYIWCGLDKVADTSSGLCATRIWLRGKFVNNHPMLITIQRE